MDADAMLRVWTEEGTVFVSAHDLDTALRYSWRDAQEMGEDLKEAARKARLYEEEEALDEEFPDGK